MRPKMIMTLLMLTALFGCNTLAGHRGVSKNIEESKQRGVFVGEYIASPNPYKINDSLQVTVQEAWIEQRWAYSSDANTTIISDGYQLSINSSENDLKNIDFDWTIGVNGEKYIRSSGKNSLISDLLDLPKGDTLTYPVQKGDNLSDEGTKDIIGKFELLRKE